ncbi:MAG: serine/threonine protein phosphatase [Magnetococcales bacterium]|nr:serine/threonine protein phosphatase [Magnetococcales bacterium]
MGPEKPSRVPDGHRVYVIGDIHGRLDLLQKMIHTIAADSQATSPGTQSSIVFLGDYIDRGPQSREVIDFLIQLSLPGFSVVCLRGNHEAEMDSFLAVPDPNHGWLAHGGEATIASYQVRAANTISAQKKVLDLRDRLVQTIPETHRKFYLALRDCHESGDYFFVHAGVRPGVALNMQNLNDFLWIRDPFLTFYGYHGRVIVHGHTVTERPISLPNRIGIDTGAWLSNRLTCLILEGETRRFLST